MSARNFATALAFLICLGTVYAVVAQRQKLTELRAQQPPAGAVAGNPVVTAQNNQAQPTSPSDNTTSELLRLRSEVTRLTARKRELAGVTEEGERLRAQLAASQTNAPEGSRLPAGYIRKSEARMVGYATPENTLQSLLWAMQHQNLDVLLQCMSPTQAQRLQSVIQATSDSRESFFKESDPIPGLAIQSRQSLPDGSVELQVIAAPGDAPHALRLLQVNGEWKFENGF